jgi:AcrR family transcriptional regulator
MSRTSARRAPLSRARVIEAAVAVADERGAAAVTMRKVAEQLGVEAMSLYHHVPDKAAILDALVDAVFEEIEIPDAGLHWRQAMHRRAASARTVLSRHSWALGLIESRPTPGPATLRHHDAALGSLLGAGFPVADSVHAVSLLDSYVYGFTLQEQQQPFDGTDDIERAASDLVERLSAHDLPHLRRVAAEHAAGTDIGFDEQFLFGLELILDGLSRHLADRTERASPPDGLSQVAGGA